LFTDSAVQHAFASQQSPKAIMDSSRSFYLKKALYEKYLVTVAGTDTRKQLAFKKSFRKWKVETAVGGGPALLQEGDIMITNNEELKFGGKAINDRHPRTAMGYTKDQKLVIMVVEGRNPGKAEGASLIQLARLLKDAGCWEALNLDGGGSSCMLVNGKETIQVSDKSGQRPVPAVFIIK
jgi:exopolysaccharide biosynthesis protein